MVERKQLDLYTLHRCVHEEGGLESVTKERKWSKIAGRLSYPNGKNVGTILKGHYERILYPYDIYMSGKHVDGAVSKTKKNIQLKLSYSNCCHCLFLEP